MHRVVINLVVILLLLSRMESRFEIRSNRISFCHFRNCEFFGVHIRNELLNSFIIERDKVIDITV